VKPSSTAPKIREGSSFRFFSSLFSGVKELPWHPHVPFSGSPRSPKALPHRPDNTHKLQLYRHGWEFFRSVKSDMGTYQVYSHAFSSSFNTPAKVSAEIICPGGVGRPGRNTTCSLFPFPYFSVIPPTRRFTSFDSPSRIGVSYAS
jgi:hypothetical protein